MSFFDQVLLFFSALGAFNGFLLSMYFAFFIKKKSRTTYFLSALIFVISIRVLKSVFLTYYPETSNTFIQIGLTACFLIGPFLYIYVEEFIKTVESKKSKKWLLHVIPVLIGMLFIGYFFPYRENYRLWNRVPFGILGWLLLVQWLLYVVYSMYLIKNSLYNVFSRKQKATSKDFWIVNIVIGVAIIWLAYNTSMYTSYIVGALSFSFTFYITLLIWVLKQRKVMLFFETPSKYANKRINVIESNHIESKLQKLFNETQLYKEPQFKLNDLAVAIDETPHNLSKFLNDNLEKNFSNYINEFRVLEAIEMIKNNHEYTLEAIGLECGFKSNSSFYSAFKKLTNRTPAQFKKTLA